MTDPRDLRIARLEEALRFFLRVYDVATNIPEWTCTSGLWEAEKKAREALEGK